MTRPVDAYIKEFNSKNNQFSLTKWVYDHPTAVKVMQVVGLVLGAASAVTLFLAASKVHVGIALGIGLVGGMSVLGSIVSWLFLKYVTCAKKGMMGHVYQEKSCEGGRIYYRGDIPVIEFTGDDPEKWGYAHGFLLGAAIYKIKKNMDLAVHSILRLPRSQNLSNVLRAIREEIPLEYLQEMQGLARGYNAWAAQADIALRLTEDDVLLIHLIPDSKHFHPKELEKEWSEIPSEKQEVFACTSLLDRDDQGNVVFGRNMDWCPFGEAGSMSLVMVWKNKSIAVLGPPGMIGAVQGWNKHKVVAAMNVCPGETEEVRGMPAILFNRYVLESAESVAAIHSLQKQPLGPYHLTVADPKEGSCTSFYQNEGDGHHRRNLGSEYVEVLNWRYPDCEEGFFNSQKRNKLFSSYFAGAKNIPNRYPELMENALRLTPFVNSWITMHSLVFRPTENRVKMSADNGYAASSQSAEAEMTAFFEP